MTDPTHEDGGHARDATPTRAHVEVTIVCTNGHAENKLATFAPVPFTDQEHAWVGDAAELRNLPWSRWHLIQERAVTRRTERIASNMHTVHDESRAVRESTDWRFYCRRCRAAVRVSDVVLGELVIDATRQGTVSVDLSEISTRLHM